MSIKALKHYLVPLKPYLAMDGVTEICINRPGEIFVEQFGQFKSYLIKELDKKFLYSFAMLIAEFNDQDFPAALISGSLPTHERIQFIMPPASGKDKIICSIRRQQMRSMSLEDYQLGNHLDFIKQAIYAKKNILISGGTGTGKTTFLNACLKEVPTHERIITIEDTREVIVDQPNAVHLLFNEKDKETTSLNIFKACLRLRPDRILLSELRGHEVWPYLRAANSGHPGSLSTIHADTVEGAFTQLVFMMQQAGSTSSDEYLRNYIKSIIHIVIQLKRDPIKFTSISEIYYNEM
jgi:type IV secretion system protein VirB11